MSKESLTTNQVISQELLQLGAFYGVDGNDYIELVNNLDISEYVEIVLQESGFEIVVGGLGKEAPLIDFANSLNYPSEIVEAFTAFALRFHGKMLYTKLCFGEAKNPPSMYFVPIEPWEQIFPFLQSLPGVSSSLVALKKELRGNQICFLLGFTLDKRSKHLTVKTYHLFDRQQSKKNIKPFLVSHRLSNGKLMDEKKHYTAGVSWGQFQLNKRWNTIVDFARSLFKEDYAMLLGESTAKKGDIKAYIFRLDSRENEYYQLKSYNYYLEEGIRLMQLNNHQAAITSLINATDFNPQDVPAYVNLVSCYFQTGEYIKGIQTTLKAKEINPDIFKLAIADSEYKQKLSEINKEIKNQPSAKFYNERGILHFYKNFYEKALKDFNKAAELDKFFADALNNAGAACLRLGAFDEGWENCRKAMQLSAQLDTTNYNMAKEMQRLNEEIKSNPSPELYNGRGVLLYQIGFLEKAEADFMNAVELDKT